MKASHSLPIIVAAFVAFGTVPATAADPAGDAEAGAGLFRACAACHSLDAGRHMTGPSLAGIWGRPAASVAGFPRYSDALKSARIVWDADTLDAWLTDSQALVPGNRMIFKGIDDAQARRDLIAFLEQATGPGPPEELAQGPRPAQMPPLPDLKQVGPDQQVASIRYCGDTYYVTNAAGETIPYWEFNLRFKTDSTDKGPHTDQPVLLPASMMGDRAFIIFATPEEISSAIRRDCG